MYYCTRRNGNRFTFGGGSRLQGRRCGWSYFGGGFDCRRVFGYPVFSLRGDEFMEVKHSGSES